MKNSLQTVLGCLIGGSFALWSVATPARADLMTAHIQESGVGNFDFMAVRWVSDAQLAPPVFRDDTTGQTMSNFGWTQEGNATVAWASFPQTTLTDFDLAFAGNPNIDVTTFQFFAFNGDTLVDSAVGYRTGTGPYNDNYGFDAYTGVPPTRAELVSATATPEPASLSLLFSVGAISLIGYTWRKRAS
jgi:hypothetical protein